MKPIRRRILLIGLLAVTTCFAWGNAPRAAPGTPEQPPFPDVPASRWEINSVRNLGNLGILKGFSDGKFHGEAEMTRYQFAASSERFYSQAHATLTKTFASVDDVLKFVEPPPVSRPLIDLRAGHWAATPVERVVQRGIMEGSPGGRFHGEEPVTRYELAQMLIRMLKILHELPRFELGLQPADPAVRVELVTVGALNPFEDVPESHWAADATTTLGRHGIFTGYPDGTYRGHRALTRYEFAVAMQHGWQEYERLLIGVSHAFRDNPKLRERINRGKPKDGVGKP